MQGDLFDVISYRPISVISVMAEVFERIVYDQLYNCLISEDINCNQQLWFHSLHSTFTALLEVTASWAFDINGVYVNSVVTSIFSILLVMISF